MEVKDSKLRAQTLPPVAQSASKGRCADDFRTRYLASRCPPRLRQGWAVRPPSLQTSVFPHLITSWSKGRRSPSSGQNASPSDLVPPHPRCWDPAYPIRPLCSLNCFGFCSSTYNDAPCFPLLRNNSWNCKPPLSQSTHLSIPCSQTNCKRCTFLPVVPLLLLTPLQQASDLLTPLKLPGPRWPADTTRMQWILFSLASLDRSMERSRTYRPIHYIVITTTTSIIVKNPLFLTWPFLLGSTSLLSPGSPAS